MKHFPDSSWSSTCSGPYRLQSKGGDRQQKKTAKGFSNITDLVDLKPIYNKKGSNYADIFGFSLCTPACSTFLNFFSNC